MISLVTNPSVWHLTLLIASSSFGFQSNALILISKGRFKRNFEFTIEICNPTQEGASRVIISESWRKLFIK